MKLTLSRITLTFFLLVLFVPNFTFAETKTFIKEYTYQAGDEDSKNSCRIIALREVKRLLLEEMGTYLESETEVKNFQMTKDQIVTLTAGIVVTEIIEDTWDGRVYWLKAKIATDKQGVIKSIDNLRQDRTKVKEFEELRNKSEELLMENKRLNEELKIAKGGKKQQAVKAYKRNIDNLNSTEWWERGVRSQQSGNRVEAIKAYKKAIELNPQNTDAYNLLGLLYDAPGTYQKSIKIYSAGIKMNHQSAMLYNNRATVYCALGNYQQAIADYNKVIELKPQEAMAYNGRGSAYYGLDNYQQAIRDYSKAIELESKAIWLSMFYSDRGSAYYSIRNYQQAIEDYSQAIDLEPPDFYFLPNKHANYNNRGLAYVSLDNYRQALDDFNKAIELAPDDAEAYKWRGETYNALGNSKQAIEDYSMAIDLDPKDADTYYMRGLVYDKLGNHGKAMADMKIAAKLGDKEARAYLNKRRSKHITDPYLTEK